MMRSSPAATPQRRHALFALVVAMVIWGSTFVVTKGAATEFRPLTLAFLRFVIAAALLAPFLKRGAIVRMRAQVSIPRLAFLSITGVVLFTSGFNYALAYGSAAQGALLYATVPAVVAVCGVLFLGERPSRRRQIGVVLSVVGAALLVATGATRSAEAPAPLLGAALMLGTVVLWGAYTVAAKPIAAADQTTVTFALSAIGSLLLLPLAVLEVAWTGWPAGTPGGWLGVFYLAAFASAGAYALYNYALRELDASTVGALTNIDPIVGVVTAYLFLGESLAPLQAGGAAVVLVGMWLASTEPRPRDS